MEGVVLKVYDGVSLGSGSASDMGGGESHESSQHLLVLTLVGTGRRQWRGFTHDSWFLFPSALPSSLSFHPPNLLQLQERSFMVH